MNPTLRNPKIISTLLFSILPLIFGSTILYSQDAYYWYRGNKVQLTQSPDFAGIQLKSADQSTKGIVKARGLVSRGVFGSKGIMMVVQPSAGQLETKLERLRMEGLISHTFPSYVHTIGEGSANRLVAFDEIVAKFKSSFTTDQINGVLTQYRLVVERVTPRGIHVLRVLKKSPNASLDIANTLFEHGYTEWSEPNFAMDIRPHDDSLYIRQWYLHNIGQVMNSDSGVDINAPQAWYGGVTGDSDIIVAVLDDGVEAHEDLPSSRLLPGWTAGGGNGLPGTGDYHGEAVAGIIAATHNDIGIRGVAPGVKIMSIKIFAGVNWAGNVDVATAIDTAVVRGADIINMSWGATSSNYIDTELRYAYDSGRGGKGRVLAD